MDTNPRNRLHEYLDAAAVAATRGGAVLQEYRKKFQVREKARHDLVTEADVQAQEAIYGELRGRFPDHAFLGEEDRTHTRPGPDSPPTWIVDPLDGTTNYVHGLPLYCVSIGLQIAGELMVGVVYDPSRHEMFTAATGLGTYAGREQLHVSRAATLDESLLATGFPPDVRGQEQTFDWWRYFSLRARSLRRTGSTALNLAYLAAGRFDGYYAFDNHVWDVAAGVVLLREAGGTISNVDGSPYDPYTPDVVASNGLLHPALLEHLRGDPRE